MFTSIPKGVKSFTLDIPVDYTIQNRYPLSSLGELFIPTINFQNLPISPPNLSSKIYTCSPFGQFGLLPNTILLCGVEVLWSGWATPHNYLGLVSCLHSCTELNT
ncbi:hypothetical protein V8G54_005563 [Vigna mungo]|uniref:Uncharacterized protein n=1 Tax=Vigna mungo TaxID=3915 RepID=A0AAQ3S754_VIGMU